MDTFRFYVAWVKKFDLTIEERYELVSSWLDFEVCFFGCS